MNTEIDDNNIDNEVDENIYNCLRLDNPKSFFLFAGAGSGKTRSLVNILTRFKRDYGKQFRLNRQKVAIITYTNAACNEISHRLEYDPIFAVSTIHSFAWELIKGFNKDIKKWVENNLASEIEELNAEQSKSRNLLNKTSIDRANKIESKTKRLNFLDKIVQFTYNPNGDNTSKDSLAASFISEKPLMQSLLVSKFPILLIDESQDTKKELIDAFFKLQQNKKEYFSLGLFGDTMQRIYSDGKENLDSSFPKDWLTPAKKMNHRSNKRIITLINNIRHSVDKQEQIPRVEKEEGFLRLFICERNKNKESSESLIKQRMLELTKDQLWSNEDDSQNIKTLILEHHMAARRMGFSEFFEPLYKAEKLSTGLLDGSLASVNLFTKIVLPLIDAKEIDDEFAIARIVKKYSKFLKKEELLKSAEQKENMKKAREALAELFSLWSMNNDPRLLDILQNISTSGLFPIPDSLKPIAERTMSEQAIINEADLINMEDEDEVSDTIIDAWDLALSSPFSQIRKYNEYISESSQFGTHQGVKGLEFPRVMVIIDDEESRGFLFSYDKLFGTRELSEADKRNIKENRETGIDRTRRLFYVACSRAKESLAIVAYTNDPEDLKRNVLQYKWFSEEEIEIIS